MMGGGVWTTKANILTFMPVKASHSTFVFGNYDIDSNNKTVKEDDKATVDDNNTSNDDKVDDNRFYEIPILENFKFFDTPLYTKCCCSGYIFKFI